MRLELRNSGEPKCEACGAGLLVAAGGDEEIVLALTEWAEGLIAAAQEDAADSAASFYGEEIAERDKESERLADEVLEAAEKKRFRAKNLRVEIQQIVSEFRQQSIRV